MERPTLEVVLQALQTMYKDPNTSHDKRDQVNKWLSQLQSSVHAWEIADQLLLLNQDVETSYFAAQTMQTKVRYSFNELPAHTHIALRDSLLNHLANRSSQPGPVSKQLCMALADLALQMQGWETVISDMIEKFGSNVSTVYILLDFLIVLPEEVSNRALRLGANRRSELRKLLGSECTRVLQVMVACISHWPDNIEFQTKVFSCLSAWLQMGNFPVDEVAHSSLISAPFQTLHLVDAPLKLFEAATDCICSALFVCEDLDKYESLANVLQQQIDGLLPVFRAAVDTEDTDRAHCVCRIFTEMAESFLFYAVHQTHTGLGSLRMFEYLLECVQHPDYELADITFNVWYRLSEHLFQLNDDMVIEVFKPYILKLISALCTHCRLDEDMPSTRVPEEKNEFADFRRSVVEVIRDVVYLVGSLQCFNELYATICEPGQPWNVVESCLFIMHAVAPSLKNDESELLPIAVPVLLSISPDTHLAVRGATLRLVAELADWIREHSSILDLVLKFILEGLRVPAIASLAAKAVHNICHKCRNHMAPHFDGLFQICEAADSLKVSNEAVNGLLRGAVEVLAQMPHEKIVVGVRNLCLLQSKPLTQLVQSNAHVQSGTLTDPALWMDRLAEIFRACDFRITQAGHPCQQLVVELWPLLSAVVSKYQSDQRIVERCCRCLRFILRSLRTYTSAVLLDLIKLAVNVYQSHHHSCFLYLGSIVVDEFGSEPDYQALLLGMTESFAVVAFPLLDGPSGLLEHPDTIDDIFRLCARMVQRCSMRFLSSPVSRTALQCALASSIHNHRDAFSSVMKFFRDLIRCPLDNTVPQLEQTARLTALQSIVVENGELLVASLVNGFTSLPSFMLVESTEVLWELLSMFREPTLQWLKTAVMQTQSPHVTDEQRMKFVQDVQECTDADTLSPLVKEFSRLYR